MLVTVLHPCPQRVVDPLVSGLNKAGPLRRAGTILDSPSSVGLLDIKGTMSSEEASINIKG